MTKVEVDNPKWFSLRLIERFSNVFYPIEIPLLLRALPTIGYIVPKKVLKNVLEPGESIATKGNLELIFNQDNKTFGVEGRDLAEVIAGFNELRSFWVDQIKPSPPAQTHYVEMVGETLLPSTQNPNKILSEFWVGNKKLDKINQITGLDTVNFGLNLVPKNTEPNSTDWFSLNISPHILSSVNRYSIRVVWRIGNLEKALDNFCKINETILSIIKEVEKG